jgi:hypothetical protein
LKDNTELKKLIGNPMKDSRQCHSTHEAMNAAMGPKKLTRSYISATEKNTGLKTSSQKKDRKSKPCLRRNTVSDTSPAPAEECGQQGHMVADCPEKNMKPKQPLYKKRFLEKAKPKKDVSDTKCYNCQQKGHCARECPEKGSWGSKFETLFVGFVEIPSEPKVKVTWDICEFHNGFRKPGKWCEWQVRGERKTTKATSLQIGRQRRRQCHACRKMLGV